MSFYNDIILPRLCDLAMRNKQLVPFRQRAIGAAGLATRRCGTPAPVLASPGLLPNPVRVP